MPENKKPTEDINKDSLITYNISNDIKYETAFIINNTYYYLSAKSHHKRVAPVSGPFNSFIAFSTSSLFPRYSE